MTDRTDTQSPVTISLTLTRPQWETVCAIAANNKQSAIQWTKAAIDDCAKVAMDNLPDRYPVGTIADRNL